MAAHAQDEISPRFVEAARIQLAKLKVKNTFIHVADSDDEEGRPAFCAFDSAPVWPGCPLITPAAVCGRKLKLPSAEEDALVSAPQKLDTLANLERRDPSLPTLLTSSPPGDLFSGKALIKTGTTQCDKPLALTTSTVSETAGTPQVKVKNTFIYVPESDDEDGDGLPMTKRSSMPCRAKIEYVPATPVTALEAVTKNISRDDNYFAEVSTSGPRFSHDGKVIDPVHLRSPAASKGSQLHAAANCKPCAWYWRPQGCANGVECFHCHQCSPAELKARKKAKKGTQKLRIQDAQEGAQHGFEGQQLPPRAVMMQQI